MLGGAAPRRIWEDRGGRGDEQRGKGGRSGGSERVGGGVKGWGWGGRRPANPRRPCDGGAPPGAWPVGPPREESCRSGWLPTQRPPPASGCDCAGAPAASPRGARLPRQPRGTLPIQDRGSGSTPPPPQHPHRAGTAYPSGCSATSQMWVQKRVQRRDLKGVPSCPPKPLPAPPTVPDGAKPLSLRGVFFSFLLGS